MSKTLAVSRKAAPQRRSLKRKQPSSRGCGSSRRVTQATIADKAGVSQTTVSLILSNKANGSISNECREKVLAAARKLNYLAPRGAAITNNIGVLVPGSLGADIFANHPFYGRFFGGMMKQAQERGYHVLLEACAASLVPGIVDKRKIDGVIVTEPMPGTLLRFIGQRMPLVLANCEKGHKDITSVMPDNQGGVREAVLLLHEKGHCRIAFVGNGITPEHTHIWERYEGYLSGMNAVGLEVREEYIFGRTMLEHQNPDDPWPGEVAADLFFSLPEPPTAIIGQGDTILFPLMRRLQKKKLRIPRDCSIIGFDNLVAAQHSNPSLTSIDPSMEDLGRVAVSELLQCMWDPTHICRELRLPTRIVMRESVARPRRVKR